MIVSLFSVKLGINVDIQTLVNAISNHIGESLPASNFRRSVLSGGVVVSAYTNGMVVAAFNHPTKNHSTIIVNNTSGRLISGANAGDWSVICYSGSPDLLKVYYGFN